MKVLMFFFIFAIPMARADDSASEALGVFLNKGQRGLQPEVVLPSNNDSGFSLLGNTNPPKGSELETGLANEKAVTVQEDSNR
jgi:hypothetical protein